MLFEPLDLVNKKMTNVYTTLLALKETLDSEGVKKARPTSLTMASTQKGKEDDGLKILRNDNTNRPGEKKSNNESDEKKIDPRQSRKFGRKV